MENHHPMYGGTPHRRTTHPTETESLVQRFTNLVCKQATTHTDHSYQPTIEFYKEVIDSGGKLSIHSGTEPEIIGTILDHEGVSDLFDVIVSSAKPTRQTVVTHE